MQVNTAIRNDDAPTQSPVPTAIERVATLYLPFAPSEVEGLCRAKPRHFLATARKEFSTTLEPNGLGYDRITIQPPYASSHLGPDFGFFRG